MRVRLVPLPLDSDEAPVAIEREGRDDRETVIQPARSGPPGNAGRMRHSSA